MSLRLMKDVDERNVKVIFFNKNLLFGGLRNEEVNEREMWEWMKEGVVYIYRRETLV